MLEGGYRLFVIFKHSEEMLDDVIAIAKKTPKK